MNLLGKFLIATPQLTGSCFEQSVIWLFQHDAKGTCGLIINRKHSIGMNEILSRFGFPSIFEEVPILWGGPVQQEQGFILHTDEVGWSTTRYIKHGVALTVSVDVLEAITKGEGPSRYIVGLGYAGWDGGQLEGEIANDSWLVADFDDQLLFGRGLNDKYDCALRSIRMDPAFFAATNGSVGHA